MNSAFKSQCALMKVRGFLMEFSTENNNCQPNLRDYYSHRQVRARRKKIDDRRICQRTHRVISRIW